VKEKYLGHYNFIQELIKVEVNKQLRSHKSFVYQFVLLIFIMADSENVVACPLSFEDLKGANLNSALLDGNAKCRECGKLAAKHIKQQGKPPPSAFFLLISPPL